MKQAVKNVEEAKAILKEHKDEAIRKYQIAEIGIFGSFVRGKQKKRSDIDILVDYKGFPICSSSLISNDICSAF